MGFEFVGSLYILYGWIFLLLTIHVCITNLPLIYFSYKYDYAGFSDTESSASSTPKIANSMDELFQTILDTPELFDLFNEYLKGLWCAENLVSTSKSCSH